MNVNKLVFHNPWLHWRPFSCLGKRSKLTLLKLQLTISFWLKCIKFDQKYWEIEILLSATGSGLSKAISSSICQILKATSMLFQKKLELLKNPSCKNFRTISKWLAIYFSNIEFNLSHPKKKKKKRTNSGKIWSIFSFCPLSLQKHWQKKFPSMLENRNLISERINRFSY